MDNSIDNSMDNVKSVSEDEYWNMFIKTNGITSVSVFIDKNLDILSPVFLSCEKYLNQNYSVVILREKCWIIPELCLFRWKYFKLIYDYDLKINKSRNSYINKFHMCVFNIEELVNDSNILEDIDYLTMNSLPLIFNMCSSTSHSYYITKDEIYKMAPLLNLFLPPKNFWNDRLID
jgi:hypothetical protein